MKCCTDFYSSNPLQLVEKFNYPIDLTRKQTLRSGNAQQVHVLLANFVVASKFGQSRERLRRSLDRRSGDSETQVSVIALHAMCVIGT